MAKNTLENLFKKSDQNLKKELLKQRNKEKRPRKKQTKKEREIMWLEIVAKKNQKQNDRMPFINLNVFNTNHKNSKLIL